MRRVELKGHLTAFRAPQAQTNLTHKLAISTCSMLVVGKRGRSSRGPKRMRAKRVALNSSYRRVEDAPSA